MSIGQHEPSCIVYIILTNGWLSVTAVLLCAVDARPDLDASSLSSFIATPQKAGGRGGQVGWATQPVGKYKFISYDFLHDFFFFFKC